jgi:hypothetical protein
MVWSQIMRKQTNINLQQYSRYNYKNQLYQVPSTSWIATLNEEEVTKTLILEN